MPSRVTSVLYADDNPDDIHIFSHVFKQHFGDKKLILLETCFEVINYVEDPDTVLPDVIFLDLNMLGNQKFECLRHLKKTLRTQHIPVVIYSSTDLPDIAEIAKSFGAYKFVVKPYSFAEVATEIRKVISEVET